MLVNSRQCTARVKEVGLGGGYGSVLAESSMIPAKVDCNRELIARSLAGARAIELAEEYGISMRCVNRLVRRHLDRSGKKAALST